MPGVSISMNQQPPHHLVSPAPSPGTEQNYSQDMLDRALEERLPVDLAATSSPASTSGTTISSPSSQQYQYSPSASQGLNGQSVPIRRPLKQKYSASSPADMSSSNNASPSAYNSHRSSVSIAHVTNQPSPLHAHDASPKSDSCGLCQSEGNCMCSDIGIKPATDIFPKRHLSSPVPAVAENVNKRIKRDDEDDIEMDFTHAFTTTKISRKSQQHKQPAYAQQIEPQHQHQHQHKKSEYGMQDSFFSSDRSDKSGSHKIDPCGFCSSGTPCICAEAADAEAREMESQNQMMIGGDDISTTLPPLRNDPHSEFVRQNSKNKLVTLHPEPISSMSGSNGSVAQQFSPGTCESCQRDPMQTLFCTSLASKSGSEGGGCGNCNQPGGCCGGKKASTQDPAFIPCSAAYQTLSRHKGFKAVELPSLVGKLTSKGGQVEVASVATILRELDRRLYN